MISAIGLPQASYVPAEERHAHLQSYLEGQSYGGETESMLNNAVDSVNYVNNLWNCVQGIDMNRYLVYSDQFW